MFAPAVPTATSTTSYVFDLDDVLLPTTRLFAQPHARRWLHSFKQTDDVRTTCIGYQKLVQPNPLLAHYIRQLRGAKYVLTNASRVHAYASLGALGLHRLVEGQLDANSGTALKPAAAPYLTMQRIVQQQHPHNTASASHNIVFFDDRPENHIVPKRLGWTTVWVYGALDAGTVREHEHAHWIDLRFSTVEAALAYFVGR